jgi:hypothetical protein
VQFVDSFANTFRERSSSARTSNFWKPKYRVKVIKIPNVTAAARADFHLFKKRGRKISGGVQATPLRLTQ